MASFAKLTLLLILAVFQYHSFTPPVLPPSTEEQKRAGTDERDTIGWYEQSAETTIPFWIRAVYCAFTITELVGSLARTAEESEPERTITVSFILGASLIITGATIRLRCVREMGRHFTFSLSLRDGHALITSGPYSIVRHPAYTGGHMIIVGSFLTLICHGSWWFRGGYATKWGLFLALNFICISLLMGRTFLRGAKEDAYLRVSFGEQWQRYAEQVSCKYIPGIW
ncbi:hypothetical protein K438DRAFT_2022723 [Mycena galopus ATCC 62051]|nr:hypothetical protein K438DRAFT_2022723 [Mycena galopus ATCC 62051]